MADPVRPGDVGSVQADPELVRRDQPRQGAMLLAISALLFAIMGVLIREVSVGVNNETVVFFRNAVGALIFLPLIGYLWDEVPGLSSWIGAGLIFASTLMSISMPGRQAKAR